jgi:hypothetical protein
MLSGILTVSLLTAPLTEKEMTDVLAAIRIVESNDDPDAVGDGGDSIGCYQIQKCYWLDAKEFSDLDGTYLDCYNRGYADRTVRFYMARYATERRLGREVTQEDIARIHNGGPNGYKKECTKKFWKKVEVVLNG